MFCRRLSVLLLRKAILKQHRCLAVTGITSKDSPLQENCYQPRPLLHKDSNVSALRRQYCSNNELSANDYENIADETLDSLTEMFEDIPEKYDCDEEYDVTYNSGVLTVKISKAWGTYVINKQSPNKQIWFSSPLSGPKRFDYVDGVWVYKHEGQTLHDLLNKEISEAVGQSLEFTSCSYGSR